MISKMYDHQSSLNEDLEESQYSCNLFCELLVHHIQELSLNTLMQFLNLTETKIIMTKFPYEILVTVVSILSNTTKSKKVSCLCQKTLYFLAIYSDPPELLLYLIEQMELTKSYHNFCLLLAVLEISLFRCKKLFNVIDMVTDVIKTFLTHVPLLNTEKNTEICDDDMDCAIVLYINISNFINRLLNDYIFRSKNIVPTKVKHIILDCLVSMFGRPVCFMNINQTNHDLLFNKILKNILLLKCDVINFCCFFNNKTLYKNYKFSWLNNTAVHPFLKIHTLSVSNFLWIGLHKTKIIKVYNPCYITYNCINISNYFMSFGKLSNIAIIKSFDMIDYGLNIIQNISIPFNALDLPIHKELIQNLSWIIVLNNSVMIQKNALNLFIKYIDVFQTEAKLMMLNKLTDTEENSKIISIVIGILKNIICKMITKKEQRLHHNQYIWNESLERLILKICFLRSKAEINILEISDEVITLLNFIIFLIILSRNISGMENCLKHIKYNFLPSIEYILPLEKDKWISKLNDLKKSEKNENYNNTIFYAHNSFVSYQENVQSCEQVINSLLLIENILFRIHELMNE